MAIIAIVTGAMTKANYDALRAAVNWEVDHAEGGILHVAGFDDKGQVRITDIWESPEHLQTFFQERLAPAIEKLKLPAFDVATFPVHAAFALPAFKPYQK